MKDLTWEEEEKICNKCKHRGGGSEWCAAVPGDYCEVLEECIKPSEEEKEKFRGIMDWKLEWNWESDRFYGSDQHYFETEEQARAFIEELKQNPHREITSMYLTYTSRII